MRAQALGREPAGTPLLTDKKTWGGGAGDKEKSSKTSLRSKVEGRAPPPNLCCFRTMFFLDTVLTVLILSIVYHVSCVCGLLSKSYPRGLEDCREREGL